MDKLLHRVRGLVERGERVSSADCRALFDVHDLNEFSKLGRIVRERRYGKDAFYRSVESFEFHGGDPAHFLSEVVATASDDAAEIAIKPASNLDEGLRFWLDRFGAFASPGSSESRQIFILLTARFVTRLAEREGMSATRVLSSIREIVPVRLSGAGGELFDDEWRGRYLPGGITSERWLAVHQAGHEIGLRSDATMTFHTGWNPDLYVVHLETLRGLQDRSGGFHGFAPMAYHDTHPDTRYRATPTAAMTLKITTISRLFLDNLPHVIALPGIGDPELSYVALGYGADTIDPSVRPSDLEGMRDDASASGAGELPILSHENPNGANKLALSIVEDRIREARWRPIPVNGEFERIPTMETER